MSHFAKVENKIVTEVIVAEQDFIDSGAVGDPSLWVQTSYNTYGNIHYAPNSNVPDGGTPLRANYAGVGFIYDSVNDVFYAPQPYLSWTLNTNTWLWEAPVAEPTDGHAYKWDEKTLSWVLFRAN